METKRFPQINRNVHGRPFFVVFEAHEVRVSRYWVYYYVLGTRGTRRSGRDRSIHRYVQSDIFVDTSTSRYFILDGCTSVECQPRPLFQAAGLLGLRLRHICVRLSAYSTTLPSR